MTRADPSLRALKRERWHMTSRKPPCARYVRGDLVERERLRVVFPPLSACALSRLDDGDEIPF